MAPSSFDFQTVLNGILRRATERGQSFVDVRSGDLHRKVGGYPGNNHRMPVCCTVMYNSMRHGDSIIQSPKKGKGANLIIRYYLKSKSSHIPEQKSSTLNPPDSNFASSHSETSYDNPFLEREVMKNKIEELSQDIDESNKLLQELFQIDKDLLYDKNLKNEKLKSLQSTKEELNENFEKLKKRNFTCRIYSSLFQLLPHKIKNKIVKKRIEKPSSTKMNKIPLNEYDFLNYEIQKRSLEDLIGQIEFEYSAITSNHLDIISKQKYVQEQIHELNVEKQNANKSLSRTKNDIEKIEEEKRAYRLQYNMDAKSNTVNSPNYQYYKDLYG